MRATLRSHAWVLAFFVVFYLAYFSPVLVSGRLLAPGDGSVSYLPAVARGWSLWIDDLFAGYPAFADTQHFLWYPLRLFGSHYNALVVSAYVIAAFCAHGFARLVSGSSIGGIVAGLVYSGGGFMTAHLGHLSIIHAAAWVPLTLWGIEALARRRSWAPVPAVACGVALSFLGGHPQVWVYGLLLAGAYAAWRSITLRERFGRPDPHFLLRCAVGVATGVAIAAVQLLPFAEFTALAARGEWTYANYISFSLPTLQLFMGVFPSLFGNVLGGYAPGFGAPSLTELSFYAGASSLVLAALAAWAPATRRHAWFWLAMAVLAVTYMTADATPVGRLGFHVPVLRSFRCLGRAGFVYILAIAVLAAHAIGALQRGEIVGRRLRAALLVATASVLVVLGVLYGAYASIVAMAAAKHVAIPSFLHNKAVWVPIVFAGAAAALAAAVSRWPRSALAALAVVVALDLASFGWFYEWRVHTASEPRPPAPAWRQLIADAQRDGARVMPLQRSGPAVPNLNLLYGLPSASGYVSLMPTRFGDLTGVGVTGVYPPFAADSPLWDLLAVRWMLRGPPAANDVVDADRWRPLAHALPEYPHALERVDFAGRAWLVGGIEPADDAAILDAIRSGVMSFGRPFDPRAVALVETGAASNLPLDRPWGRAGTVQSQRLSAGHWRFVASADRAAVLVVSQMDYPGWQATVNGRPVPLLRVDYALQGVVVSPGESVVELAFRPRSLRLGSAASLFGLLVVTICGVSPWLGRRRRRGPSVSASRAR
ncbi:YfhO family protein [Dokdonella sp.]|uniref:YfhO family protein n=1 Tax=Dokdonella sp. TaxID=2291710 RepID=UPI002F40B40E